MQKQKPRTIKYRDYKNVNNTNFRLDLLSELSLGKAQNEDFDKFNLLVNNLLQSHAPIKKNYVRRNQAPFMNKSICRSIWVGSVFLINLEKKTQFSTNYRRKARAIFLYFINYKFIYIIYFVFFTIILLIYIFVNLSSFQDYS